MKQLDIPNIEQLKDDTNAIEILRFWISSGECHVSLNLGIWADEGKEIDKELTIWSYVLSDTVQHIANGLNKRYGISNDVVKELIKIEFNKCMYSKTDGLDGE